jgi:endonuclease/exonuclease/phosphatase (EEP) superfamily protein YafD
MKTALEVIGYIMLSFTFLPMIRTTLWWVRILDFPRFQIAFITFMVLFIYGIYIPVETLYQYIFIGCMVLVLVMQGRNIYPFTIFSPKQAQRSKETDPENTLCLMVSNVRMENRKSKKYLQIIKDNNPDMIIVNEPDQWWAEQLAELDKKYPYHVKRPLENTYGMMLFSKFEFVKATLQFLVQDEIPSIHVVIKLPSREEIELCAVHPTPPTPGSNTDKREAELLIVGKNVKKSKRASIVAGDLNDVGWSHTTKLFQRISGLLDPRVGRGFFNTYNVFVPFFRYPLDHVFYDPRFKLVHLERLPSFGSDHFPILIKLLYKPEGQKEQHPKKADREDKQEAEELIEKGLAES